ncbi:hypothetical protein IX317_001098 [Fusobacterium sp. DD29]|uniref:helix-turn-helix domain-containing protein n=1 Tax=unclassified Fusobacterium TaxID=2648384 RepID=UPI001B8ACD35|nr:MULTISPECIES: helix-turn-helix transcriptional regulator [unclassified Fusobacterium]MBR8701297.1 hypothetical protein [Fusobacterium sp. DD45]MBR8711087.1 hypothetical protein [Fusobacterium sp. DD28]MBR8749424.1 hypothetical protein [Fusobacterium sp. DD29]MBR8751661.1 hypothetical protein [Fusobacterium sp. DD26]MBR8761686.1 hypothetical protein [Fusobacterium sp. DD25]
MTLKKYLKKNNISQTFLSKKLKIRKQTVSTQLKYWENGGTPTLKSIIAWSNALNISSTKFLEMLLSK